MSVELAITDMNTSRVPQSLVLQPLKEFRVSSHGKRCHLLNFISVPQKPTSVNATYKTPTSISTPGLPVSEVTVSVKSEGPGKVVVE